MKYRNIPSVLFRS